MLVPSITLPIAAIDNNEEFSKFQININQFGDYDEYDFSSDGDDIDTDESMEKGIDDKEIPGGGTNNQSQPQRKEGSAIWLLNSCQKFATMSQSAFDSGHLAGEILKLVHSSAKSEANSDLDSRLFDLLGESGIEFMFELIQNFDSVSKISIGDLQKITSTALNNSTHMFEDDSWIYDSAIPFDDEINSSLIRPEFENLSLNQRRKREKKEQDRLAREREVKETEYLDPAMAWLRKAGFGEEYLNQESMLGLHGGASSNSNSNMIGDNSWKQNLAPFGSSEIHEKKGLPAGTERKVGPGFEEVDIPAPAKLSKPIDGELVEIEMLEKWAQLAFQGTKRLNRIQSKVFNVAYNSSENMLVCAPTGAGKTNIAMLTFLQLVKQNISGGMLDKSAIKAIYIAPMKALAQEVVAKFSERLETLGIVVKEFTGDMQLTKQEVLDAQFLVTTPEKYDVVTRKGGDGSLGTMVNLIIIDEVHLLADDRGAVIETIVARTQRYVESSQQLVRIVGLSATLPNYKDVASFLRVNLSTGMFHFGPEYRPVPLQQTFIGVTEKQRNKRNDLMNRFAFEKMTKALERGKQVMIFVHSRKETSRTAEAMRDLSGKEGTSSLLENVHHEKYTIWKRQVDKSRSLEVQQLFSHGLGVHHAGMLRADRTMTEQLFECGLIKVLCCTATLAWGVNLPAHTVIIKGTELYDPERGGFVDLSILDVFQIFGRAGRPQYDNCGHAILITPHKSLANYLSMMGHQAPIESGFIKSLADHMNAEIVNGTINNIKEAASWLSYTFLFIRMSRNPVAYGLTHEEKFDDPQLDRKRVELVCQAAEVLDNAMMIRHDKRSGNLAVTDLGRIASHFYIKHGTIEAFNAMLTSHLNDSEALHVLCSSAEFDQLKVRPEELSEIDDLKKSTTISVKGAVEETAGKVNVLLQGFINQNRVSSFTLQSDMNYVAQNAGRITRALFEICLKRGWSTMANHYLSLCKCIDRRMRIDQSPLRQFYDEIPQIALKRLEETQFDTYRLLDMEPREIGQLCHSQKYGSKILNFVKSLPYLEVEALVQPLTRGILRISLSISAGFNWNDRYHGFSEPFWIWVEDGENEYIYHSEYFLLNKKQRFDIHKIEFTIPIREPLPPQYYIRAVSDRWVGCENVVAVSFQHLILPDRMPPHTNLLDMHPIPRSALKNERFEALYRFTHFNPIQSQTFHALYHSDNNILVGAPTGSGKTITGELAILRMISTRPGAKAIYVAPLKALARERLEDWKMKLGEGLGLTVLELTGDVTPDIISLKRADVLIVTPEKWDSISRGWKKRDYVKQVELVIIDEIHLLGVDRGPVLEVIVSRMRFISCQTSNPIRFVGLSTALANPRDLADWLGIGEVGVYNFRPSVRPIPMSIHIQGFPGKHYCPRMATMNKPTYAAILEHSPLKPVLIFVSSRRQTRLTALDLISYCASDDNPKQFLHMPEEEITTIAETLRDSALRNTIVFGVAIHHAGLDTHDRTTVEELFYAAKIQILVCTSTLAWGVNLPCHLVVVKGTEFYDGETNRYVDFPVTDVLQMIGRAGRPQFDETGVACVMVHEPKKNFYRKFLHEPFPVESSLQLQLHNHINAEIATETLLNLNDCTEYLTWTYFFRRLLMNPSYYDLQDVTPAGVETHLNQMMLAITDDLKNAGCIEVDDDNFHLLPTTLGRIASYYYLDYRTVGLFRDRLWAIENATSKPSKISDDNNNGNDNIDSKKGKFSRNNNKIDAMSTICELTRLLADAYEFSELPVRHNEDVLNAQLADNLPWSVDNDALDSSHVKTFLLLQAHFTQTALPISDYINDTKSVLDQAPRVLNALIDIAADLGFLDIVLEISKISQMLVQGLLLNDSKYSLFMQLPSITYDISKSFVRDHKLKTFRDLILHCESSSGKGIANVRLGNDFYRAVKEIPQFEVSFKVGVMESEDANSFVSEQNSRAIAPYNLPTDTDCNIELIISRLHGSTKSKVYSPHYHKPKVASYWAVAGLRKDGELLALKRIGSIAGEYRTSLSFISPETAGSDILDIYIICDAMIGVDKHIEINLISF